MKTNSLTLLTLSSLLSFSAVHADEKDWGIDSQKDWKDQIESSDGVIIEKGMVSPKGKTGTVLTKIRSFDSRRSVKSLTIAQSPIWQNWNPTENLGPSNLNDAPVLLTMGPKNYWMFGLYGGGQSKRKKGKSSKSAVGFISEEAKLSRC